MPRKTQSPKTAIRNFIFWRIVNMLGQGRCKVVIKDFHKEPDKNDRDNLGAYFDGVIELSIQRRKGSVRTLVHEAIHALLMPIFVAEGLASFAENSPANKSITLKKFVETYNEALTYKFEADIWEALNKAQKQILQCFIDDAHSRYTREKLGKYKRT